MKTFIAEGDALTLTAPSGGVVSGVGYLIGASLVVIATHDAVQGASFIGYTRGVVDVAKVAGATWTPGQLIYYVTATKNFSPTVGINKLAGVAVAAAESAAVVGQLRLNGAYIS